MAVPGYGNYGSGPAAPARDPFRVGLARRGAFFCRLEQLFLRDFSEEFSMLHESPLRLAERPVLVTFNGKSFDWPLLENRFTMTPKIAVPKPSAHLDSLHPARALWKLCLVPCA